MGSHNSSYYTILDEELPEFDDDTLSVSTSVSSMAPPKKDVIV